MDKRLREETSIGEEQFDFMPGRRTTDAIFAGRCWKNTGRRRRNYTWCLSTLRRHMTGYHGRKFGCVRGSRVFLKSMCVS